MHLSQSDLCFCTNRESVATQICSLSASLASRLSMRIAVFYTHLLLLVMQRILEAFISFVRFEPFFFRSVSSIVSKFPVPIYLLSTLHFEKKMITCCSCFLFAFVEWSFQSGSREAKKLISSGNGSAGELVGNQETRTPFEANATCTTTTVTSKWQGKRSIVE